MLPRPINWKTTFEKSFLPLPAQPCDFPWINWNKRMSETVWVFASFSWLPQLVAKSLRMVVQSSAIIKKSAGNYVCSTISSEWLQVHTCTHARLGQKFSVGWDSSNGRAHLFGVNGSEFECGTASFLTTWLFLLIWSNMFKKI